MQVFVTIHPFHSYLVGSGLCTIHPFVQHGFYKAGLVSSDAWHLFEKIEQFDKVDLIKTRFNLLLDWQGPGTQLPVQS